MGRVGCDVGPRWRVWFYTGRCKSLKSNCPSRRVLQQFPVCFQELLLAFWARHVFRKAL